MPRTFHPFVRLLPASLLLGLTTACAAPATPEGQNTAADTPAAVTPAVRALLAREPLPDVYSAGQPDAGDWHGLAEAGITTVIDLRPDAERPGRDEAAEVRAAGLAYTQIPVAGPQDLTRENAATLRAAIDAAPGKVLVHCASANRAGALIALTAAGDGIPAEEALRIGRAGGMVSTEARVRALLETPVSAPASN